MTSNFGIPLLLIHLGSKCTLSDKPKDGLRPKLRCHAGLNLLDGCDVGMFNSTIPDN